MLIYLDNCCFNRPFDDQSHITVRLEAEAKLAIQDLVIVKAIDCLWSFVLEFENEKNPFLERKISIGAWSRNCVSSVEPDNDIRRKACIIEQAGMKGMDALHLAAASHGKAKWFITTDRGILKRQSLLADIKIATPIEFLQEWENRNDN